MQITASQGWRSAASSRVKKSDGWKSAPPTGVTSAPRAARGRVTALCSKPEMTARRPGPSSEEMAMFSPWVAFIVKTTCSASASKSAAAAWRQEKSVSSAAIAAA